MRAPEGPMRGNESLPIGCGIFRKEGSYRKSWRERIYFITSDKYLVYMDPESNVVKGKFSIEDVLFDKGLFFICHVIFYP